jgi:hypothetical protein
MTRKLLDIIILKMISSSKKSSGDFGKGSISLIFNYREVQEELERRH